MVTIIEVPFVTRPTHIVVGMRSKPQTLRVTQLVSVHREIPKNVNKVFAKQPSCPGGGGSRPLKPPRPLGLSSYFGLLMMNPSKPPLPPNKPYH
jgi:hypothetical protein